MFEKKKKKTTSFVNFFDGFATKKETIAMLSPSSMVVVL
jgi:hypothetical protein